MRASATFAALGMELAYAKVRPEPDWDTSPTTAIPDETEDDDNASVAAEKSFVDNAIRLQHHLESPAQHLRPQFFNPACKIISHLRMPEPLLQKTYGGSKT